ncbi:ABC transporter permease [Pseudocolwellia agarivorans]|uniref:ABC transporter permease n=1 Tax=Pseudocolwellia agarivorans TaxID=1911682 RepID=UPI00098585A4|nr:ABC transporter permease [Pseudocolwellia agarivorans]
MIQFKALLIKEFKEAFRDKRALMVAMTMAMLAPVMILVLSKTMIKEMVATPPIYLNVTGESFAPKLIKQLKQNNIYPLSDVPEDIKNLWTERNIELIIPENFAEYMEEGRVITINLRADFSEKALNAPIRRIKNQINQYAQSIGAKRLIVRGIDPRILRPIQINDQDTAQPSSNAMFISLMLGLYVLMAAFMSGLSVAIDSSAGERERNVLEMLLCQPVSTFKIVAAKLCCASTISIIGVTLTLVLTSFSVSFVDLTKIGATFNLDLLMVLFLILLLLPISFFASALQLFVSFQAKSFKEAQSTVSMIIMLPAMIPVALMFIDDKPQWLDWLPVSGQSLLMDDLFKGIPINWAAFTGTALVTVGLTAALVIILSLRLKSEKVVLALS